MVVGPLQRVFVPAASGSAAITEQQQKLLTIVAATYNVLSAKYSG